MVLSEEDMAWRAKGIGGSDARTIAEGSGDDWQRLKNEKINNVRPVFTKQQRFLMDLGTAVEPVVLDYCHDNVTEVARRGIQSMMAADNYFRCTLDGITTIGQPIQCKLHTGDKNIDDLIEFYWAQLQHEMLVTAQKSLVFCVAFGHYGQFGHEIVERDFQYQSAYMERALRFKAYCWDDKPLPDGMKLTDVTPIDKNIPRLRDHVWPTGDNRISMLAHDWLANGVAAQAFNEAASSLKKEVPEDCRSATWVDAAGTGIKISVSKSGAKTIKPYVVRS